jgi:hypothetical protein
MHVFLKKGVIFTGRNDGKKRASQLNLYRDR